MFLWVDDPGGNVEHVAEHGLTPDEVESAFEDIEKETTSRSTGRPAIFGRTFKGDTIFVAYDLETDNERNEFVDVRTASHHRGLTMKAKPNVSAEQLARLRAEDEQLRPMLESEMPAVREEWRQYVRSLTGVVSRHSKEIDEYIQNHGPMTRPEVIERALTKLLSEV